MYSSSPSIPFGVRCTSAESAVHFPPVSLLPRRTRRRQSWPAFFITTPRAPLLDSYTEGRRLWGHELHSLPTWRTYIARNDRVTLGESI